jgi:hypothetical protein
MGYHPFSVRIALRNYKAIEAIYNRKKYERGKVGLYGEGGKWERMATNSQVKGQHLPADGTKVYDKHPLRNARKEGCCEPPESRRREISG